LDTTAKKDAAEGAFLHRPSVNDARTAGTARPEGQAAGRRGAHGRFLEVLLAEATSKALQFDAQGAANIV